MPPLLPRPARSRAWSRTTPAERSALLLKLADRIEAEAEAFAKLESQNCGKPPARALADELPAIIDCFRFFAGAARCLPGSAAGEYERLHQHGAARPGRRGRRHRALELPADDGGVEARAGARRRQHRGAQALGADPAHHAQARDAPRRDLPQGRGQRGARARRERSARRWSPTPACAWSRSPATSRPAGRCCRRRPRPQAHPPRARRQGAGDRVRRRRSGGRGRGRAHVRLLQRRPGLHRRLPDLCRAENPRPSGRRSGIGRRDDQVRRPHRSRTWRSGP